MLPNDVKLETLAVHAGMSGVREAGQHVPSIDLSTTNPLPGVELGGESYEALATGGRPLEGGSLVYQRLWNPGVARFEESLAALEGAEAAVAFSTGMAAISAVLLAASRAGTPHVVAIRPIYGGTDHMLDTGMLGTSITWVDAPDAVTAALRDDTGLVLVESPANPTLELVDIRAVVRAAGDVPVLVDNTFATPVLQRPLGLGAALSLHSATKYLGGHGDVMGGVVATSEEWAVRLRQVRALTGGLLHPLAAYLLHRGMRTLPVRVRAQQETAGELARRLEGHPAIRRLHYPGLPGQDPLGLIGTQSAGPGSMLALDLGGFEAAARFAESCELVCHAVSLGGVDSLVEHPASLTHRPVAASAKPGDGVVRLSIGLEHVDDLEADLRQALDRSTAATGERDALAG